MYHTPSLHPHAPHTPVLCNLSFTHPPLPHKSRLPTSAHLGILPSVTRPFPRTTYGPGNDAITPLHSVVKVPPFLPEKLEAGHVSDKTMFALSWDTEELNRFNSEGRSLRTEISAAIDVCSRGTIEHNLPRKLPSIRKKLCEFVKKVT